MLSSKLLTLGRYKEQSQKKQQLQQEEIQEITKAPKLPFILRLEILHFTSSVSFICHVLTSGSSAGEYTFILFFKVQERPIQSGNKY